MCMELMKEQIFCLFSSSIIYVMCLSVCFNSFFFFSRPCVCTCFSVPTQSCLSCMFSVIWLRIGSFGVLCGLVVPSFSQHHPYLFHPPSGSKPCCVLSRPCLYIHTGSPCGVFLSPSPLNSSWIWHASSTIYHKTLTCMWIFSFINVACL